LKNQLSLHSVLRLCAAPVVALSGLVAAVATASTSTVGATSSAVPTYDVAAGADWNTPIYSSAASPDGSVFVAGKYAHSTTKTWGTISRYESNGEAGYLAKIGPDGVWDWVFDASS
jgi:hypothetical protein